MGGHLERLLGDDLLVKRAGREIDGKKKHECEDHGLVDGVAYALGSALGGQALIGRHQTGHDSEDQRFYPQNDFLSQTLGFVGYNKDSQKAGLYGLEKYFDGVVKLFNTFKLVELNNLEIIAHKI